MAILTPDGRELTSADAEDALGEPLLELLDTGSRELLLAALGRAPVAGLELFTVDGRVLDARVVPEGDDLAVVLRDVSRYVEATEQLGSMAVSLARRNRDLETLYKASSTLDATLDLEDLARGTCEVVADYLDATHVQVTVIGITHDWPAGAEPPTTPPSDVTDLRTARGELGQIRWWRETPLGTNEAETLPLLVSRAAIGLDHALLLSSAQDRASRDELTGLLNRAGAREALARLVTPFPVALLDLDHFKSVNDDHGHAEGDRVLREVATILDEGRDRDVKVRWGGEEFLVALEHATVGDAVEWVRRRLDRVRSRVLVPGGAVSFSAGVAVVDAKGLEAGITAADEALYAAKRAGRGRIEVATGALGPEPFDG